jgi:hypothetical protein
LSSALLGRALGECHGESARENRHHDDADPDEQNSLALPSHVTAYRRYGGNP